MSTTTEKLQPWFLESLQGDPIPQVEDFLGKPLLVVLFNLTCPGCIGRAIPFANRMVVEHGDKLHVIGIHTHIEGPDLANEVILQKMEDLYVRFPFYKDAGLASTFFAYGAGGTPHWFLTDAEGTIVQNIFGSDPNRGLLRLDLSLNELLPPHE